MCVRARKREGRDAEKRDGHDACETSVCPSKVKGGRDLPAASDGFIVAPSCHEEEASCDQKLPGRDAYHLRVDQKN